MPKNGTDHHNVSEAVSLLQNADDSTEDRAATTESHNTFINSSPPDAHAHHPFPFVLLLCEFRAQLLKVISESCPQQMKHI